MKNYLLGAVILFCSASCNVASAQTWTRTSAPTNAWTAVAASADGTRLVAVGNRFIYTSTNYGLTWISNSAPITSWLSVASSADGTKLASVANSVYTNSGTVWTLAFTPGSPGNQQAAGAIASSADGTKLVIADYLLFTPSIYTSTNAGATWLNVISSPSPPWDAVASSADGNYLLAARANNISSSIYTSTNAGTSWVSNNVSSVPFIWTSLASSANGSVLLAAAAPLFLVSTNAGTNWTYAGYAGLAINKVACSTNGNVWFGVSSNNGQIYSSLNAGAGWITNNAPRTNWIAIAVSKDGNRAVAATASGGIYTLLPPPLSISNANNKVSLVWTTNEIGFGLQQNTNLVAANWVAVTNEPVAANTFYQVSLPATNHPQFFRLAAP
jgi:hypothetical protein